MVVDLLSPFLNSDKRQKGSDLARCGAGHLTNCRLDDVLPQPPTFPFVPIDLHPTRKREWKFSQSTGQRVFAPQKWPNAVHRLVAEVGLEGGTRGNESLTQ